MTRAAALLLVSLTLLLARPSRAEDPSSQPATRPASPSASAREQRLERELGKLRDALRALERKQRELVTRQDALEEESVETQIPKERTFNLYGFFDFNFQKWWVEGEVQGGGLVGDHPSFVFGNLNTYLDFKPLRDWRMLAEIRFLLSPLGDTLTYESTAFGTRFARVKTTTTDRVNFGQSFDYGSIEIERATLEWKHWEWLSVGAGLFLTPYGLWNIDHGSPTQILTSAPLLYLYQAFPERQLGFFVRGTLHLREVRLEYTLSLSNGRGPQNALQDLDWDKALGGRVAAAGELKGVEWQVGVSWYWGSYTNTKQTIAVTPSFDLQIVPTVRYRELAIGADLTLRRGPLELDWEAHANWRNYDDGHRPILILPGLENFFPTAESLLSQLSLQLDQLTPDRAMWGTNLILAYRLPLRALNLRTFVSICWIDPDDNYQFDDLLGVTAGLNWRIGGAVAIKVSYDLGHWPHKLAVPRLFFGSENVHRLGSQLSVAF
jgi:hypothetical protein